MGSKNLKWDEELQLSIPDIKTSLNTLLQNRGITTISNAEKLKIDFFPTHFILAQLSKEVYEDKCQKELYGWLLITTAKNKNNGFFACAYVNIENFQIVVAHRGTSLTCWGSLWADFHGILLNQYTPQIISAITFAHILKQELTELHDEVQIFFTLSFTGHSLGGWLAQISSFSCKYLERQGCHFIKLKENGWHTNTVAFDSPGCESMLRKLQDDIDLRYEKSTSISDLDISVYLSAPNRINIVDHHVGTIYRLFPNLSGAGYFDYIFKAHKIKTIVEEFNPQTGKADEVEQVLDWMRTRKEYGTYHGYANKSNNYHVSELQGLIRYQTKPIDPRQCKIRIFSSSEIMLLDILKILIDSKLNLEKLENFFRSYGLGLLEDLIPYFSLDKEKRILTSGELETLVRHIKQLMRWFTKEFMEAVENQLNSHPSILDALLQHECTIYLNNLYQTDIEFDDVLDIQSFILKSERKNIMYITSSDPKLEVTRVYNICKRIVTNNINYGCTKEFVEQTGQLFFSLQQLMNLTHYMKTEQFFKADCLAHYLLVVEVEHNSSYNSVENRVLLDCIRTLSSSHTPKKVIIVDYRDSSLTSQLEKVDGVDVKDADITFSQLSENSQKYILNRKLFEFENQRLSLIQLLGIAHNDPKIEELLNFDNLKLLITSTGMLQLKHMMSTTFTPEVCFVKYSKEITLEELRGLLLRNESFYASVRKPVIIFVTGISETDLQKITNIESELKRNIENKSVIVCQENTRNVFEDICWQNTSKMIYWLNIKDNHIICCEEIFDFDFYVPRKFVEQNSFVVDKALLLKKNKAECIVIDGVENKEKIAAIFGLCPEEQHSFLENKGIVTDSNEISLDANSVHHILLHVNDNYENLFRWTKSKGSLDSIRKYVKLHHTSLCEDELYNLSKKVVIINGEPGMGKSTSLNNLYQKMNSQLVVYTKIRDSQNLLEKLPDTLSVDAVTEFLLKESTNTFQNSLLRFVLKHGCGKKIYLLFDGFDEIYGDNKKFLQEKCLSLLQYFSTKVRGVTSVFVTTRKNTLQMLENRLSVFATNFVDLDESQQKNYFRRFWRAKLLLQIKFFGERENKLDRYIDKLFEKATSMLGKKIKMFMSVPLQMRMLAEIAQPDIKHIIDEEDHNIKLRFENVFELYQKFIEEKYNIFFKDKMHCSNLPESFRICITEQLNKKYRYLAFQSLYPNDAKSYLENKCIDIDTDIYQSDLNGVGLIQSNWYGNYEFCHKTFVEYYIAELVGLWLNKLEGHRKKSFIEQFLINQIFLEFQSKTIRLFFNDYLDKNHLSEETLSFFKRRVSNLWQNNKGSFSNEENETPLHISARERSEQIMKLFLVESPLLWSRDKRGQSALRICLELNYEELAKIILHSIQNFSECTKRNILLSTMCKSTESIENDKATLSLKALLTTEHDDLKTIIENIEYKYYVISDFIKQVKNNDVVSLRKLLLGLDEILRYYVKLMVDKHGRTALHIAAREGYFEIVKELLEDNAEIEVFDEHFQTPFHHAIISGKIDIVKYLFEKGASFKIQDKYKMTPLAYSARHGQLEILKFLIDHDADFNMPDRNGITPFEHAAKNGYLDIVIYLHEKGANIHASDKFGMTAFSWAAKSGHLNVLQYLKKEHDVDVNQTDIFNMTPLQIAVKAHKWEVVKLLVEWRADLNISDQNGVTALKRTEIAGKWDIYVLLKDAGAK